MTDKASREKKRRDLLKAKGLCVRCSNGLTLRDNVHCSSCLVKRREASKHRDYSKRNEVSDPIMDLYIVPSGPVARPTTSLWGVFRSRVTTDPIRHKLNLVRSL